MAHPSLLPPTRTAGLPDAAAIDGQTVGSDPVFPVRYRVVTPGAASIGALGVAASDLWSLNTGRRAKNCAVPGMPETKSAVADAVAKWDGVDLETTLHESGGCGSFVRSEDERNALPCANTDARSSTLPA